MSDMFDETGEQREIIFLSQNGWVEWVGSDEIEWEGPDVSAAEKDLLCDYEKLKSERDQLRQQLADTERERDDIHDSLVKAIRQRDEAVQRDALRKIGTSVAATSTWGQAIASMAVSPMTGRQLRAFWAEHNGDAAETWDAIAAHIWPNAQPTRREQLRKQVKRTDHGDKIVILELSELRVIMQGTSTGWWWNSPSLKSECLEKSLDEAIAGATEWLVNKAMKAQKID